jgi:hypothetical protein
VRAPLAPHDCTHPAHSHVASLHTARPKIPIIGFGAFILIAGITIPILKNIGAVAEFGGDVSAFAFTLLPKVYALQANNWAKIPTNREEDLVRTFIASKTKKKAQTGQPNVTMECAIRTMGLATSTHSIEVGQHHVKITNEGCFMNPIGTAIFHDRETLAFAIDDIEWLHCIKGKRVDPVEVAMAAALAAIVFFVVSAITDDKAISAYVAIGIFFFAAVLPALHNGATVEFGLRGGVQAVSCITSMHIRRELCDLINARQIGPAQAQPAQPLKEWTNRVMGGADMAKKSSKKIYNVAELRTHSFEVNTMNVGCHVGPCLECCVTEMESWNLALKHMHSIQTEYTGQWQLLLMAFLFVTAGLFLLVEGISTPGLAIIALGALFVLAYHCTKMCFIFVGTNETDMHQKQPALMMLFRAPEETLNSMLISLRSQQATNLIGISNTPRV